MRLTDFFSRVAQSRIRVNRINWVLIAIAVLGLGLRLWGIGFGLPYMYHPDEGTPVQIALRILHTGNLSPGFFNWPSLLFYLDAVAYSFLFVAGRTFGAFATPNDLPYPDVLNIGVGRADLPEEFLIGRGLTAAFGVLAIIAVYWSCRQVSAKRAIGWLGALWLAVDAISIRHSQFIRPDMFLIAFALLALVFALRIVNDPQWYNYVLAGLFAGLATSSKYTGVFIVIPIGVAHFIRFRWRGLMQPGIYISAIACVLAFFLTTPYAILDWEHFWQAGILGEATHYATGHAGAEGDVLQWYVSFLYSTQGVLLLLALLESIAILRQREPQGLVLISFPIGYFLFINLFTVRFETTILPVIPFVIILAALGIARLQLLAQKTSARVGNTGIAIAIALVTYSSLRASIANNIELLQPDSRETARVWIENNLPAGARVAIEPYSPYVDPQQFTVVGVEGMTAHSLDWYVQNGFEYLVFSYGTYGRFYENRARYADTVAQYDEFFERLTEVKRFNDGGYEIRIYKTGVTNLPTHRVAARFGIYGNWLELVGYDVLSAQVNQPLSLVLHWRALESRREPLQLTVRVRDAADREVAQSSGALFGTPDSGDHWREGITRVPWTMDAPTTPGMYRLELNVDARGQGRVPVLSRANEPISDKLFIAPFKISPTPPSADEVQRACPANVQFGDAITLLGYVIQERALRAGDVSNVTLYWKSTALVGKDYTVFVHLLDAAGNVRAQIDTAPRGGAYPTSVWDAGEIVRDDYALPLPRDLAPGAYRIEIGLYQYPSLARLAVVDADGQNIGQQWLANDLLQVLP